MPSRFLKESFQLVKHYYNEAESVYSWFYRGGIAEDEDRSD